MIMGNRTIYNLSNLTIVAACSSDEKQHVFIRFRKGDGASMWIGHTGLTVSLLTSPSDRETISGVDII
jgi:hypothetical protein